MNYQQEMENIIGGLKTVPKLLLHSCCGPCSSYCLETLSQHFYVTVLWFNPNIQPRAEYDLRLETQKQLLSKIKTKYPVELLTEEYDDSPFLNAVVGLENEPEGGLRCTECFKLRLEEAARLAQKNGFDYFTTTLTVSPHKNAPLLNEIGFSLEKKYGVRFLPCDFKKKNGYKRSIELSKEYGLYRQNYCGCAFSVWEK